VSHYLRDAFFDGLNTLDTEDLLQAIGEHIMVRGEWEPGVISPSLTANECRLARLKIFLGDAPQPGYNRIAVRAGAPDAISQLNFIRGFCMEGAVVAAIRTALGKDRLWGNAPSLLFRWRYKGEDFLLNNWKSKGMVFAGHPDMMVWPEQMEMELVQIKTPSIFKFERVERMGKDEALRSYRAQMATELYIGRKMGYPIERNHLFMVTWEGTPKMKEPHCNIVTMEWDESMAMIPEEIGREIVQDYDAAYTQGRWPAALPPHQASIFPCLYCRYPRHGSFDTIGCEEQGEWQRFEETGETRLTVEPPPANDPQIITRKRRLRK